VEHEYERRGTLAYLAAWDVQHARLFGRTEPTTGVAPFGRLVDQVMATAPYRRARRVYWVVDNGSSHCAQATVERLAVAHPKLVLVHLPIHASWLSQVEVYFSVMQRKLLTPAGFASPEEPSERVLAFRARYEQVAAPFDWRFIGDDLRELMARLAGQASDSQIAA
jgi:hypothetical protein